MLRLTWKKELGQVNLGGLLAADNSEQPEATNEKENAENEYEAWAVCTY